MSYVYLAESTDQRIVKVGFTACIPKRYNGLRPMLDRKGVEIRLRYVGIGTRKTERKVIDALTHIRPPFHGREWFDWDHRLLARFRQIVTRLVPLQDTGLCPHGHSILHCEWCDRCLTILVAPIYLAELALCARPESRCFACHGTIAVGEYAWNAGGLLLHEPCGDPQWEERYAKRRSDWVLCNDLKRWQKSIPKTPESESRSSGQRNRWKRHRAEIARNAATARWAAKRLKASLPLQSPPQD